MPATIWQLQEHDALLRTVGLAAQLNLAQPSHGLSRVAPGGKLWQAARLLGLTLSPLITVQGKPSVRPYSALAATDRDTQPTQADALVNPFECYVRGDDLVSAYETTDTGPMHVDALWRAVSPDSGDKFLTAIDLIVSVRTQQFDAKPEVAVQSTLPACEVLRLSDVRRARYQTLLRTAGATTAFGPDNGAGCVLFRVADPHVSYAEMVHPVDFCHDELIQGAAGQVESGLVHRLFRTSLEKGVILRARVRGVFVPRIDDRSIAAECYAAFAAAGPPLGT